MYAARRFCDKADLFMYKLDFRNIFVKLAWLAMKNTTQARPSQMMSRSWKLTEVLTQVYAYDDIIRIFHLELIRGAKRRLENFLIYQFQ